MNRLGFTWLTACALAALVHGCGSSHTTGDDDGGIEFDAELPDRGMDGGGTDSGPEPACGDGRLDPMEQCDDGNTEDGDGCSADCTRESFCGDGNLDDGEVCDDGNNASGDGCRSDCGSDESCGNGIRDVVVGEQCDDGNTTDGDGCSSDCQVLESCGDGTVDDGEECDDGNTMAWDGCGADCTVERSLVINSLELGDRSVGCDFSGDGNPDNSLARALGPLRSLINDMFLTDAIANGDVILLLHLLGLDDPAARDDPSLTVGWLQGQDADGTVDNNFSGMGEFLADEGSLDDRGLPVATFESMIMASRISGGPEDIELPLGPFPLEIRQSRLHGTMTRSGGEVDGLDDGLICGAVPLATFAFLPNFIDMFMEPSPPCDGTESATSMADVVVGGTPDGFIFPLRGTQPDVDVDHDGLESFEVDDGPDDGTGEEGCQPVITACIDGDGTRTEGRDCALDARYADGYSTGLPFTAVRAFIVGTSGGMSGGGDGGVGVVDAGVAADGG